MSEPTQKHVEELLRALRPFALAAEDYEQPKSKNYRNEEHVALSLTAGDVRIARRVFLAHINASIKSPSETYHGHPRLDTGLDYAPAGFLASEAKNVSERNLTQSRGIPVPVFTSIWDSAPRGRRARVEREDAEWWFERGRGAEKVAQRTESQS